MLPEANQAIIDILILKAALPIAANADVVDLDGPVLLGEDVEDSLKYHTGKLYL